MEKNVKGQIQIGALIAYISIGFNIVFGLIYTPWMIEQIGKSDYGIYTIANSVISLFLFDFGLSASTSKFVASYRFSDDYLGMKKFLSAIHQLYLLIDLLIFFILAAVFFNIEVIYSNLSVSEIEKLKIVFLISGLYSIISFPCTTFNGILTAYEKIIALKITDLFYRVGTVFFTIISLILNFGVYSIVIVNATCGIISIIAKYIIVKKNIKIKIDLKEKYKGLYKEVLNFSIWSTVIGLSQSLVFNITPTLISMVTKAATEKVAIFGVISTIEGYFYIITTAINGMFIARITDILKRENHKEQLTTLAIKVGKIQFIINGLLILGFALIGKEFMILWMGADYIVAYYGILLVEIPCLFFNPLQIANTALIVQNQIKYRALVNIAVGVCNVILALYFSYLWGVIGASLSICVAYILRVILSLLVIRWKLKIDLKKYIKDCYIKMLVPLLLSFVICLPLILIRKINWWNLVCKGIVISAVYLFFIVLLGTDKTEKNNIVMKVKSILSSVCCR